MESLNVSRRQGWTRYLRQARATVAIPTLDTPSRRAAPEVPAPSATAIDYETLPVTLVLVNVAVDRSIAVNATAARLFEGTATTVIRDRRILDHALRRLGVRSSEIEHAVRIQNADDVAQIELGSLDPNGQLLLTLQTTEQSVTKADVAELTKRLERIERLLSSSR